MDKTLKYYNKLGPEGLGCGRKCLVGNGKLWGTPQAKSHWPKKHMVTVSVGEGHVYWRRMSNSCNKMPNSPAYGLDPMDWSLWTRTYARALLLVLLLVQCSIGHGGDLAAPCNTARRASHGAVGVPVTIFSSPIAYSSSWVLPPLLIPQWISHPLLTPPAFSQAPGTWREWMSCIAESMPGVRSEDGEWNVAGLAAETFSSEKQMQFWWCNEAQEGL